jgi:tRNA U34 2-thiouridine synthase MnmA/TrmU
MSNSEFSQSMLNPARDLDVSAVFMRNWSPLTNEVDHDDWEVDCAWEKDWEDVQIVCKQFGVPVKLVRRLGSFEARIKLIQAMQIDLSTPYWLNVFEPAITAWQAGRTPNPDVSCNKEIKFGRLLEETFPPSSPDSSVQGSNPQGWLVTGHYASTKKTSTGRTRLIRPVDPAKDQTYYLSSCSESQLSRALFPLENLRKKDEVREIARAFKLGVAEREESMGVCFVGEKRGKFGNFVCESMSGYQHLG